MEYIRHTTDETGKIDCVYVNYIKDSVTKTKACIGWITKKDSITATYNIYSSVLLNENGEFNEQSLIKCDGMLENIPYYAGDRFQIERVGYFIVDHIDIDSGRIFINQIVGLREDKDKHC